MQKNTSSTIISVALLALLVWALSSGKEDVKPRKKSDATQLAKETPLVREGEKIPLEKPPGKEELKATNQPPEKEAPEEPGKDPVAKVGPAPVAPPLAQQPPGENTEPPENRPPPAPVPGIIPVPKASVKGIVTDGEDKPIVGVEVSLQAIVESSRKKKNSERRW